MAPPVEILCVLVLVMLCSGRIREITDYNCTDYVGGGSKAADFDLLMKWKKACQELIDLKSKEPHFDKFRNLAE
ncbi:hypothetical protein KIN20_024433 [Parelaphostrongylus tenuis]|uniref:Uncharacterized protein n=1 Tax=Parelaphostrongylus tenuis TaxID=148309 RepID=A0AAD5N9Z6_PARTN|nr:hypothetical protein KIN20_024433 [Parelaphostrongylus tenuis]